MFDGAKDCLSVDVPATHPEEDGGEENGEGPQASRADKNETV